MVREAGVRSLREAKLRGHQTDQVQPWPWHQRHQALHELQQQRHQARGAVAPGGLELEHHLPGCVGLHALVGQCRAGDVAAICPSACRSSAAQRTAACKLKPSMSAHSDCLRSISLDMAPWPRGWRRRQQTPPVPCRTPRERLADSPLHAGRQQDRHRTILRSCKRLTASAARLRLSRHSSTKEHVHGSNDLVSRHR